MGPASLHNALNHILTSIQYWGDVLTGRQPSVPDKKMLRSLRPLLVGSCGLVYLFGDEKMEDQQHTSQQMLELLNGITDDIESSARSYPVDEGLTISQGDRSDTFGRGTVLMNVTTHEVYHRSQCLNMLYRVGVETLPASSVHEWILMVNATECST